jgi:hypothetical protein
MASIRLWRWSMRTDTRLRIPPAEPDIGIPHTGCTCDPLCQSSHDQGLKVNDKIRFTGKKLLARRDQRGSMEELEFLMRM